MTISIEMEQLFCGECGVAYCVPAWLFRNYSKSDEEIHCPNGHGTCYVYEGPEAKKEEESEKIKELRREHMLALHQADQAAAKAMEGKEQNPVVLEDDSHCPDTSPASMLVDDRIHCPQCDPKKFTTFKLWSGLERHLRKIHKLDEEAAEKIVKEMQQARYSKAVHNG